MKSTNYKKGDKVIYGTNGICTVEDIQKMMFPMETEERTYYVLKPVNTRNSTLFVPDSNEELMSKIRYILTKEEIDAVISGSNGKRLEWSDEKNARLASFNGILKSGNPEELLLLIKCVYDRKTALLDMGKKLPAADENILVCAEKLVREEFAYVLGISEDQVGEYIRTNMKN